MMRLLCLDRMIFLSTCSFLLTMALYAESNPKPGYPSCNSLTSCDVLSILLLSFPFCLLSSSSLAPPFGHYSHSALFSHWYYNSLSTASCQPSFHVAALVTFIQSVSNCVLPLLHTLLCLGIRVAQWEAQAAEFESWFLLD